MIGISPLWPARPPHAAGEGVRHDAAILWTAQRGAAARTTGWPDPSIWPVAGVIAAKIALDLLFYLWSLLLYLGDGSATWRRPISAGPYSRP